MAMPDEAYVQGESDTGHCMNTVDCHPTTQVVFWSFSMGIKPQCSVVIRYEMEHHLKLAYEQSPQRQHGEQPGDSWPISPVKGFKGGLFA